MSPECLWCLHICMGMQRIQDNSVGETFPSHGGIPLFEKPPNKKIHILKFQPIPTNPSHPLPPPKRKNCSFSNTTFAENVPVLLFLKPETAITLNPLGKLHIASTFRFFGRFLPTCTSPGPRRPLDPSLAFLIWSFHKFHPCHSYKSCHKFHPCHSYKSCPSISRAWNLSRKRGFSRK